MSSLAGICLDCVHMDKCRVFNKDRNKVVVKCGRFSMNDTTLAIMKILNDKPFEIKMESGE